MLIVPLVSNLDFPAVDKEEMSVTLLKTELQLQFSAAFSNVLQFSVSPHVDSVRLDLVSLLTLVEVHVL